MDREACRVTATWETLGLACCRVRDTEYDSACRRPFEGGFHYLHSVQFSHPVVSNSLQPHGLQHTRLPCPSPSPGACSNSCPLIWRYHPTISSSVIPFSCLQSFPASGSFLMNRLFTSDDQSIGASASSSVLPMNIQD